MIPVPDSGETRRRASKILATGGVIAFRTDTFYGLGADPFNRDALRRLKSLKGREGAKPILVVISDLTATERFILDKSRLFETISSRHWPGALTIVVGAQVEVPGELTAMSGTIGLRLPDDENVRSFIRECGGALTATSANIAGEPPARSADEVARSFPTGLDLIVDGGTTIAEKPSTVIDIRGEEVRLIREGAIPWEELRR